MVVEAVERDGGGGGGERRMGASDRFLTSSQAQIEEKKTNVGSNSALCVFKYQSKNDVV